VDSHLQIGSPNYNGFKGQCLRLVIDYKQGDLEERENSMNVGMISSQRCQYSRKAGVFHQPWAITIKGSMPKRSKWVVPPILKLWLVTVVRILEAHTLLHCDKNHNQCISA